MALEKTVVSWSLTGGINTKDAPIMLQPGSHLVLDNVRQERKNEWRTRGGNTLDAANDLPSLKAPVLATGAPWGGFAALCRQTDIQTAGRIYEPTSSPRWHSPPSLAASGANQSCSQVTPGIWHRTAISPMNGGRPSGISSAEGDGYRLTAWWYNAANQGIQVSLTTTAGASLDYSAQFAADPLAIRPRCVYSSVASMLVLVWTDGLGNIRANKWSTVTGLSQGTVLLTATGRAAADCWLDAIYYGGNTVTIAYRNATGTGGLGIIEYNPATNVSTTYTPGENCQNTLAFLPDPDVSGTRLVAVGTATPEVRVLRLDAVGTILTNHVAAAVDPVNIAGCAYGAGVNWMIVYGSSATALSLTAVKRRAGVTSAAKVIIAAGTFNYGLASGGWREADSDPMRYLLRIDGPTGDAQPSIVEMALDYDVNSVPIINRWTEPQARILPLNSYSSFERASPPQVFRTGTDRFVTVIPRITRINSTGDALAQQYEYAIDAWSVQYMNSTTYTGVNQGQGTQTPQCAYLPVGSLLQTATGQLLCSHGSTAVPFLPACVPSAAAGGLTPGARYQYVQTVEMPDEAGNVWRSPPSTVAIVSAAAMAGNNTITVTYSNTPLENQTRRRIVKLWRTDGNGSVYRLIHLVNGDVPSTLTIVYVDLVPDGGQGELLSTEVRPTITPAFSHLVEFGNRMWGVMRDFPDRVMFSKPIQPGISPEFPSTFLATGLSDEFGDITGLSALDDRLVVMKARATYVSPGNGPDNNGNGAYPEFARVSSENGCIPGGPFVSTGSEVYMTSSGGVYRLTRAQEMDFVGAPIDQYLSMPLLTSPETVTGMVISPGKSEVRIQTTHYRFVHDRTFNIWERDTGGFVTEPIYFTKMLGGVQQVFFTAAGRMWTETPDSPYATDAGVAYQGVIRSPWIRPTGVGGWLRLYRSRLEGTVTATGTLGPAGLDVYFDDNDGILEQFISPVGLGSTAGTFKAEARTKRQKCTSFSLKLTLPPGDATVRLEEWWVVVGAKTGAQAPLASDRWKSLSTSCNLPLIAGTVALWQFNRSLVDSSGNGLNLTVDAGVEVYEDIDTDCAGFRFDDGTPSHNALSSLIAPASSLLSLTNEFTIQFLIKPRAATVMTYLQYESGATTWYSYYCDTGTRMAYADSIINLPVGPPYIYLANSDHPFGGIYEYAIRRTNMGAGVWRVEVFIDGVPGGGYVSTSANAIIGSPRLRIGGFSGGPNLRATVKTIRILNYARSNADIAADNALRI